MQYNNNQQQQQQPINCKFSRESIMQYIYVVHKPTRNGSTPYYVSYNKEKVQKVARELVDGFKEKGFHSRVKRVKVKGYDKNNPEHMKALNSLAKLLIDKINYLDLTNNSRSGGQKAIDLGWSTAMKKWVNMIKS